MAAVVARVDGRVVAVMVMLPVRPVAVLAAHVDAAATSIATTHIPMAVVPMHVHASLDCTLQSWVTRLVAALLDIDNLGLHRSWLHWA